MKQVILYGGAFNPPTTAHLAILQACVEHARLIGAEVWLLPSGQRPDKSIATDMGMRLKLIDALVQDTNGGDIVRIEEFELYQTGLIETYTTADYLRKNYPEHEFIWVFGSDSITTMKSWGEGERLWTELSMLVIERPGHVTGDLPPKAAALNVVTPDTSSTEVRRRIASGEDYSLLVAPSVRELLVRIPS